ncbi:hypothetical protein [Saccharopolyspora sp. NPDC002376]
MSLVIGVVVHARRLEIFKQAARTVTGATVRWAVYQQQSQIGDRVRELLAEPRMDGILLGLLPFELARDLLPESMVVAVPQPSALDLALAFGRMRAEFPLDTPVSIDTFDREIVDEVASALGVEALSLPYSPGQQTADIVEHHRNVLRRRGGAVITMRMDVADRLRAEVSMINSSTVPSTVRAELHELVLRIRSGQASAFRFTAGIFRVHEQPRAVDVERARVGMANLPSRASGAAARECGAAPPTPGPCPLRASRPALARSTVVPDTPAPLGTGLRRHTGHTAELAPQADRQEVGLHPPPRQDREATDPQCDQEAGDAPGPGESPLGTSPDPG